MRFRRNNRSEVVAKAKAKAKTSPVYWIATADFMREKGPLARRDLFAWERFAILGRVPLLSNAALGLFCADGCPEKLAREVRRLVRALRDTDVAIVSAFETETEKEILSMLLRAKQPAILCPARTLEGLKPPPEVKEAVESGRALLMSPFDAKHKRATAALAEERDRFIDALAIAVFVAHADERGRSEQICRDVRSRHKPVLTVDHDDNQPLVAAGARRIQVKELAERLAALNEE
jgi:predicted Rossmann fold nucleotide-binding protein DprA/Smf involved in DNA uptake